MKIKSIKPCGLADVYNMEVEKVHEFAIENGIISHNCADEARYICMARPIPANKVVQSKEKPYNPLDTETRYDGYNFYRKY